MGLLDQIGKLSHLTLSRTVEQQEHDAAPQKHQEKLSEDGRLGVEQPLLSPYKAGMLNLDIRMVYAPLTRCRAIGEAQRDALFCTSNEYVSCSPVLHQAKPESKRFCTAPYL